MNPVAGKNHKHIERSKDFIHIIQQSTKAQQTSQEAKQADAEGLSRVIKYT